jgi:branched-chain amino acid aminotransferase
MGSEVVWIDGEAVPAGQASVPVLDRGLTVGDGVFETLKAIDGVPFAARRHLDRLRRSAEGLDLEVGWTDAQLRAAMTEVVARSGLGAARVRITVTAGVAPLGWERGDGPTTVIVAAGPLGPPAPSAAVCTVPWPLNERSALAGLKTISYAEHVRALAHARARGCAEALLATTTGLLAEGTGSNVFVVHDGRLSTPPLSTGCLAGVTRDLVLEITEAVEADLPIEALAEVSEAFLTSTTRGVQPIASIDGRDLGAAGPRTLAAAAALAALEAATADP